MTADTQDAELPRRHLDVDPDCPVCRLYAALDARDERIASQSQGYETWEAWFTADTLDLDPAGKHWHLHETILRINAEMEERDARIASLMQDVAGYKQTVELQYDTVDRLTAALAQAEAARDGAYLERNQVVAALAKCFPSGVARTVIDGWSTDWHGCVYIDLPSGQVSWHYHDSQDYLFTGLPPYGKPWDGHDTPEKYRRVAAIRPAAPAAETERG